VERIPHQAGAVFELVHDGCTVEIGIFFDHNGAIVQERGHCDPTTLRACGWAN
jgi:hypothetical protein